MYLGEAWNGTEQKINVIRLREECVVCLSLELQHIECALTHDVNDLYVTADRGHILIVQSNIVILHSP